MKTKSLLAPVFAILALAVCQPTQSVAVEPAARYSGAYVEGEGDRAALEAIDAAFESMRPSAKMACLPLCYKRDWDGFAEGPTWPCWWIQNSFGPSYAMMPFLGQPYATWLEHSQELWFRLMGDGQRKDIRSQQGPDGCLCDAAFVWMNGGSRLGFGDFRESGGGVGQQLDGKIHRQGIWYSQGDGPVTEDWFMGATAAGLILESERQLVKHDVAAAKQRLPQLERVAAFLDSRRDGKTNLLKGGRSANLLAPGYLGFRTSNLTFELAYLTELSVNYIAGLERLAEVCVLCGEPAKAQAYRTTASKVRKALPKLMTPEGYFIMAEDPDGSRHGVFGAEKHGYFEATPNHDAGCFEVTDDAANKKIIQFMLALRGKAAPGSLAPYGLILPNYPGYDDSAGGEYGNWVNGGHWTTTQARMSIACLRADEFAHPLGAWAKIRKLMEGFRADAPLTGFGSSVWNGSTPYNVVYDCWGASGGLLRGLFEYDYRAVSLRIRPHLPPGITRYVQKSPVYFGKTRIYITVTGSGAAQKGDADGWIELHPDAKSGDLCIEIVRGDAKPLGAWKPAPQATLDLHDGPATWRLNTWDEPTSGNDNPLRVGASPSGGANFDGQVRDFAIYRRPLSGPEIADLAAGKNVAGATASYALDKAAAGGRFPAPQQPANQAWTATLMGAKAPAFADSALVLEHGAFVELPPSADIDFQDNFTIALAIRPTTLGPAARLIDRTTGGTMNGYLLDYLQNGAVLRLITPHGVAQGPVKLQTGKWYHVAATCTADGLMRVYLDGVEIAESQGAKLPPVVASANGNVDLKKAAAFYTAMTKAGLGDTYEAAEARAALELLAARHERQQLLKTQKLPAPDLGNIPPCDQAAVDAVYFNIARWIAGGLTDRLAGRGLWSDKPAPETVDIARKSGIIQ